MSTRFRIPITAITVFGISSLLALSIGVVLYLGLYQAAESTRQLWANQSRGIIDSMESSLNDRLHPVRDQALWVSRDITDLGNLAALDDYFFGVLSATPQVAGVAVISIDGTSRRWHRNPRQAIAEDWSQRPWLKDYIDQVRQADTAMWREPIFSEAVDAATLLHDVPLRDSNGEFIGVFAQIITIRDITNLLARNHSDTGIIPFVLYDRDYVLAHPALIGASAEKPMPRLSELGDLVLEDIWSPNDAADFIAPLLVDTEASGSLRGDDYYLYLYRNLERFGPAPWTIGVYLNTNLRETDQVQSLVRALVAGLLVLLLAIIVAILAGRKVSGPIRKIAAAADSVESGELDSVAALGDNRIRELDDASSAFNNMVQGLKERELIRETLGRFVPEKIASSLLSGGGDIPVQQTRATILFCDIEAFTRLTETLGPVKIVDVLNAYFSAMVDILERHGGVVTQFQGDAILATFNVPVADEKHAQHAFQAACEMLDEVAANRYEDIVINIRIGINTGEVVAGAIGARGRLNYTVHGDAVNLAARVEALNKEYGSRLLVTESTASQVDDDRLHEVGETIARGQTRTIRLFSLEQYKTAKPQEKVE